MEFYKTVSLGNDFIHIAAHHWQPLATSLGIDINNSETAREELSRQICTRETGVGADGVIYYGINQGKTDFDIFNRDGSHAEISGNGMSGLAAVLFYTLQCHHEALLQTRVGLRKARCLLQQGNNFRIQVELGPPDFSNQTFFPFLQPGKDQYNCAGVSFYPVSVGNPHAVVVMDADSSLDLEANSLEGNRKEHLRHTGKMLATAGMFPFGVNVEIIIPTTTSIKQPDSPSSDHFRIFYYERGVGMTGSSSTGSAAAFAVLQRLGLIQDTLIVPIDLWQSPDTLPIKISGKKEIYVENSTKIVYKGLFLSS